MSARLLIVGSINVDLVTRVPHHPAPGETILGEGGSRSPGGKGANQALAAALQGAQVTVVGCVGQDPDADLALSHLREAAVNLDGVVPREDHLTGMAVITVSADGENTIVVIPGANSAVSPLQAERSVRETAPGDILLAQGELERETTEAAVRAASRLERRVILNVAPWGVLDDDVLTVADPLVLNRTEAHQAAQALGVQPRDETPISLACALQAAGVPSVVLTLDADGAVAATSGSCEHVPSPTVRAVDTTGAGDAFAGALAAQLLRGSGLTDAVCHAVRVGAFAVTREGAQASYPGSGDTLP